MVDWTEVLSNAVMAVLTIVIPALATYLGVLIKAKIDEAKANIEAWKPGLVQTMEDAAEFGVKVAEQMGLTDQLSAIWASKKDCALDKAQEYLNAQGFEEFDLLLLSSMIEKAVLEQFPKKE